MERNEMMVRVKNRLSYRRVIVIASRLFCYTLRKNIIFNLRYLQCSNFNMRKQLGLAWQPMIWSRYLHTNSIIFMGNDKVIFDFSSILFHSSTIICNYLYTITWYRRQTKKKIHHCTKSLHDSL